MRMKKLFLPLIMLLIGCYNNPFLADTYKETFPNAVQEKASYKIQYYQQSKDLQSYELENEETVENFCGTSVTCDVKNYEGFTFDESNPENIKSGIVTEDDSLILKLYYNRNKYIVTFDKNSETAIGEMPPQTFYYGVSAKLLPNSFTDDGYVFIGWAKKSDAVETDFTDTDSVLNLSAENNAELTLYAVWEKGIPANYTVEYYHQAKDLQSYEKIDSKTLKYVADREVTATVDSYEGFTFDESNPENIESGIVTEDGSLVLKLYYNRNKYIVTFDKNSETAVGEMQPQTFYYGIDEELILQKNSYSNGNFPFIGWAKKPDAAEAEFKDCSALTFDLAAGSGELTLYAIYSSTEVAVVTKLTGKITGADEDLADGSTVSTSRDITVNFETNDFAVKGGWKLGDLTGDISDLHADFSDLKDGMYTFRIWCENESGIKSEEKTFSWTIAADVKLNISGIPNQIIKIGTDIIIDVSGDNLASCSYVLNDEASVDVILIEGMGKIFRPADKIGDFELTITGKNILDETTDENISWSVVTSPVAKLSGVVDFMAVGSKQVITVSDCQYYMYRIKEGSSDDSWSQVFPVEEKISIENKANSGYSYTVDVIGGTSETFSDDSAIWQSEAKPTSVSWKIYPVYDGASLDSVLKPANKVSGSGVSGKNIYATYDDNFIYFGYESQTTQQFSKGTNALCIAMKSSGAGNKTRYGIKPADHLNETEDNAQPTFELSNEPVSHFLKISFDSDVSGTAKFFSVNGGKWIESASAGIQFEVNKNGKCVIAVPRVLLASPNSELRYVIYMRCYSSKTIYAIYPKESDSRANDYAGVYTSNIAVMTIN